MLIGSQADMQVVAQAGDGQQAIELVAELQAAGLEPDVVLMDVRMPVLDGIEATGAIIAAHSEVKVVMLTTFDIDDYVYAAVQRGASGFLLKDVTSAHLAAAVRLVDTGDALLAPSITRRLVERFATGAPHPAARGADSPRLHRDLAPLTPREVEVLGLLGRGLSNTELAVELTLSESTVKTHVARIFAKLNLRDRAQAVVLAYETGLVAPGDANG